MEIELYLEKDERWPDYSLSKTTYYLLPPIKVPVELYERYQKAVAEYNEVQELLADYE